MNAALPLSQPVIAEGVGYRPTKIDGYEIQDIVGRGGMGIVYRARHIALGRDTAIKLIRNAELADPKELSRFHYEAEMAAALQHPNIVQLFQYGEQDGRPYLAFEYVEGGSLEKKVNGRPQPPDPTARLVETLARAVHAAHLRGIVHQDLKPANVLLTNDGTPKIADFGLARRLENMAQGQSEVIVGTACYMSPEQAWGDGQAQRIGPPTDIYALGAILYELLTGRPPFLAESSRETLEQVWTRNPTPPRQIVRTIPRDLEIICLRCLQKDQTRRYPSAEALADDLRRYVDRMPIKARPVGEFERAWLWSRRNPANAGLVAALLLVATVGFASTINFAVKANAEADKAKINEDNANEETRKAKLATEAAKSANEEVKKQQYPLFMVYADREILQGRLAEARNYLDRCREQDRRLEWHFSRRITLGTERQVQVGTGKVNWLAASPDGKAFLANLNSAGGANSLHPFGAENLAPLAKLPPAARKSSISPEGKYVAVGAWEELHIHRAADGKLLHKIPGALCSSFAPQGQVLAVGVGKDVIIYQLGVDDDDAKMQSVRMLEGLPFPPVAISFGADEQKLFILAAEPYTSTTTSTFQSLQEIAGAVRKKCKWQIFAWDRVRRESNQIASGESALSWDYLAASQDGSLLIAGNSGVTGLYEWKAFRVGKNAAGIEEAVPQDAAPFADLYKTSCQAFALSRDGKRLAHANYQGAITVIDLAATGGVPQTLRSDQPQVESLAFLSSDKLLSGGTDGSIKLWNWEEPISGRRHLPGEMTFASHPTRPLLATTAKHGEIRIWDMRTLRRLKTLPAQPGTDGKPLEIDDLKFSGNGEQVIAAYHDHAIRTWDLAGEKIAKTFTAEPFDPAQAAVVDPTKPWAAGSMPGVKGFTIFSELKQAFRYHISPDGRSVARRTVWYRTPILLKDDFLFMNRAVSPTYYRLDVWDLENAKPKFETIMGEAPIGQFADLRYSPSGEELVLSFSQAFSSDSRMERKFSAADGKETFPLAPVRLKDTRILSPDGSRAVELRNSENELLLIDTQTDFVLVKPWAGSHYFLVEFTPDGQRVIAWNSEGIDILDGTPANGAAAMVIPPAVPVAP